MAGPLAGVKVLEIASIVLGPLAGQYLGDLGADVIKLEPPEGDLTRGQGPRRNKDMSALFLTCNRNKRSVVIDFKSPEAKDVIRRLAANCDVVIHSIRSQAAQKLGLIYEELVVANPGLIFCHVKGFSDDGEYSGRPAYDDIIQGLSGLGDLQKSVAGEPRYVPAIFADKLSGVHAALAVMGALFSRASTGIGQRIDVPMFETLAYFNMIEHLWGATFEPQHGPLGYPSIAKAARRPFKTKDGYLSFLPHTDAHWRRFLGAISREDLIEDAVFRTFASRQEHYQEVWSFVINQLQTRTTQEWLDLLVKLDLPVARMNDLASLIEDPHLRSIDFWQLHEHPTEGTLRLPKNPLFFGSTPAEVRRLPPLLGEHTEEILRQFGFNEAEIKAIKKEGGRNVNSVA